LVGWWVGGFRVCSYKFEPVMQANRIDTMKRLLKGFPPRQPPP
jgi:hypothetical protein